MSYSHDNQKHWKIEDWMQSVVITCPETNTVLAINRDNLDNATFVSKIEETLTSGGWLYNQQNQLVCALPT